MHSAPVSGSSPPAMDNMVAGPYGTSSSQLEVDSNGSLYCGQMAHSIAVNHIFGYSNAGFAIPFLDKDLTTLLADFARL